MPASREPQQPGESAPRGSRAGRLTRRINELAVDAGIDLSEASLSPAEPGEPRSRPLPVGPREPWLPDLSGPGEEKPSGSDRPDVLSERDVAARRDLTHGPTPPVPAGEGDPSSSRALVDRTVDALVGTPQGTRGPANESAAGHDDREEGGVIFERPGGRPEQPNTVTDPEEVRSATAISTVPPLTPEGRAGDEREESLNPRERAFLMLIKDHPGDLVEAMRAGIRQPEDMSNEAYGLLQEERFPDQTRAITYLAEGLFHGALTPFFVANLPPGLRDQVSAAYDVFVARQRGTADEGASQPSAGPISPASPAPVSTREPGEPGLDAVEAAPAASVAPEPKLAESDPVESRGRDLGARLTEASEGSEPSMRNLVTALQGMEGDPLKGSTGGAAEMRALSYMANALRNGDLPRNGAFLNSLGDEIRNAVISRLGGSAATQALAGELRASYEEYVAANTPPLRDPGDLDDSIVARPAEPLRAPIDWAPPPLIRPRRPNEMGLSSSDITSADYLRILSRTYPLIDDYGVPIDDSLRGIFADRIPGGDRMTDREIARRFANTIGDEGRRPEDFNGLLNTLDAESRRDMWHFLQDNLTAQIDRGNSPLGIVREGWRKFFQGERDERIQRGGESAVRELVVDYNDITSARERKVRQGQILDALVDMNSLSNLPRILDQIRNDKDRRAIEKEFYRIARIHVLNDADDPRYEAWAESDWYRRMRDAADKPGFLGRLFGQGKSSSKERGAVTVLPGDAASTEDIVDGEALPASRARVEVADPPVRESVPGSVVPFSQYLETLEGAAKLDHPVDANNLGEGTENAGRVRITNTDGLPPILRSRTLQEAFRDELSSDTPEDINRLIGQIADSMVRSRVQEGDLRRFLHLISDRTQRDLIAENFFNRIRNIQLTRSDPPSVHGWRDMWRENQDYINDSVNRIIRGYVQPSREFLAGRPDEFQRVMDNLEARLLNDPSLMPDSLRNDWLKYAQDIREQEVVLRQSSEERLQNAERREELFGEIREDIGVITTNEFSRGRVITMVERARELVNRGGRSNGQERERLANMMTTALNGSPDDVSARMTIGRYILSQSEQAVNDGRYDDAESFLDATEILGLDLNNNIPGLRSENIQNMRDYIQSQRR